MAKANPKKWTDPPENAKVWLKKREGLTWKSGEDWLKNMGRSDQKMKRTEP